MKRLWDFQPCVFRCNVNDNMLPVRFNIAKNLTVRLLINVFIGIETSAKDSRKKYFLKNLPVVASIITGSTETQLNAFLQSMGMAKIAATHYYNFQRDFL